MQQKSIVAILVALVVILAGTTIYFAMSKNTFAPSVSQTVPAQSIVGTVPVATNQTATQGQTATNNKNGAAVDTADWKTYTNSKYKFSINYPASCVYKEMPNESYAQPGLGLYEVDFNNGSCASGDYAINLKVRDTTSLMAPNGMDPVSTKDVIIDGKKAKNYDNWAYVVSDGKFSFEISSGPDTSSLRSALKMMVDSFKFLK